MQTFSIPDVPLIPQTKTEACWYASAQMLIAWRRARTLMCEAAHPAPSDLASVRAAFIANHGLPAASFVPLAKDLGLKEVPPMTPSPGSVAVMLKRYGPLWFAGYYPSAHVVVITGISPSEVSINDPWPVNKGDRRRINFQRFHQILQPISLGGTHLAANLLHFPG